MTAVFVSAIIFVVCLLLFFSERIDRAITALCGAVLMVIAGLILHFYTEAQAIAAVDFQTIYLLVAMMVLVALMEPSGFFQYLAIKTGKISRGNPFLILTFFAVITSFFAMILNSLTAIILVAPITILICEILGLNPQVYLITEALFSNLGGMTTLIGSVPNVMVGSVAGFSFVDFLTHSFPTITLIEIVSLGLIFLLYRKELAIKPSLVDALMEINPNEAFTDKKRALKIGIGMIVVVLCLLVTEPLHISPALVALTGSAFVLMMLRPSMQDVLKNIQWDMLIFFISLFVIIGGMNSAGVFTRVAQMIAAGQWLPPVVFSLIFMWCVALLSAFVANVPIVIALIPIVQGLAAAGINPIPLYWAVIIGVGLGGNGTIIGSAVNVIAVSYSKKTHHPITAKRWSRLALPVTFTTMVVASVVFVIFFPFFQR